MVISKMSTPTHSVPGNGRLDDLSIRWLPSKTSPKSSVDSFTDTSTTTVVEQRDSYREQRYQRNTPPYRKSDVRTILDIGGFSRNEHLYQIRRGGHVRDQATGPILPLANEFIEFQSYSLSLTRAHALDRGYELGVPTTSWVLSASRIQLNSQVLRDELDRSHPWLHGRLHRLHVYR